MSAGARCPSPPRLREGRVPCAAPPAWGFFSPRCERVIHGRAWLLWMQSGNHHASGARPRGAARSSDPYFQVWFTLVLPLAGVLSTRFAPLSQITFPAPSRLMYLYSTVWLGGSVTTPFHTG